jgi:hypothetical protein
MRRHDELAAGTVLLPVSRNSAGPSAHRRMRPGGQRCMKRRFRTRPWVPSSGWLEGVLPTASRPANWSVKSSRDCLGRCRGRLPHPHERGKSRRSSLGRGREGNPGGRAASQSRATGRPHVRTRTDNTPPSRDVRAPTPTAVPGSGVGPDLVGDAARDASWGVPLSGVWHGCPLGRARMRRLGRVDMVTVERGASTRPPARRSARVDQSQRARSAVAGLPGRARGKKRTR